MLRCVERCCPSAAQARRSETCSCARTQVQINALIAVVCGVANLYFAGTCAVHNLHDPVAPNLSVGQTVNKGDVIGKVSNLMTGGGTSIHLHIQCTANHPDLRAKVNMPIYTSLISAYRREWQLPDMIESGALLRDPERELGPLELLRDGADTRYGHPEHGDRLCSAEAVSATICPEESRAGIWQAGRQRRFHG